MFSLISCHSNPSAYQLTNLLQNTCSNFSISFIMKFQILGFYPNCATPHHPTFLHSNLPCQAVWSHLLLFLAWFPRLRIPLSPLYLSTTLSYCIIIFHVMCLFPQHTKSGQCPVIRHPKLSQTYSMLQAHNHVLAKLNHICFALVTPPKDAEMPSLFPHYQALPLL